ncbi:MAG: dihydroorotate dehydrogenase electron transfer subunit, partial [Planctomycetaceae bacterium]
MTDGPTTSNHLPGLVATAVQRIVPIVEHEQLARDTYRMRLYCPEIAAQILPGQFFMLRAVGETDPLLGRPFALYDIYSEGGRPAGVDFGYVVVGKLTSLMRGWKPRTEVEIWGPLGNGFPPPDTGHLMMVAGGIGQTPFLAVAREALGLQTYGRPPRAVISRPARVSLCYGVRSDEYLAGVDAFAIDGLELQLSTDDGSRGHHGFVTDLLQRSLTGSDPPNRVYCCGPEPMMHAVAKICARHSVRCWLSLESPMACGFGVCFSCVVG